MMNQPRRRVTVAVRALALVLVVAIPAGAQQGPDSSRVLFGLIVDSVHGGPLRGATVRVGETGVTATTDSAGRYRLIGIPSGRHRVELLHPLLDTLRLAVRTNLREFGDTTALVIGTPSAATLIALK